MTVVSLIINSFVYSDQHESPCLSLFKNLSSSGNEKQPLVGGASAADVLKPNIDHTDSSSSSCSSDLIGRRKRFLAAAGTGTFADR